MLKLNESEEDNTVSGSPTYQEKPKIVVLQLDQKPKPNPKFYVTTKKTLPPPTKAEQIAALKRPVDGGD